MARPVETVSGDQQGIVGRGGQSLALAALCTLLFLTFLDNTVVSVALGDIYSDPGASPTELQWVVGAYALTFASLMLACGMIGDELGRKKVMLASAHRTEPAQNTPAPASMTFFRPSSSPIIPQASMRLAKVRA